MKKILSVLLVICIACSALFMVSCGNENGNVDNSVSAKDLVKNAVEKTENADAVSGKMSLKMSMSIMGMSMEVPMDMDIKILDAQSEFPKAYIDLSMSMLGTDMDMSIYTENGWGYYEYNGASYKAYIGDEGDEYTSMANNLVEALPDNILEGKKVIKNSDGTKSVTVELSKEEFGNIYADFVKEMYSSLMGTVTDIEDLEIDDIVLTYTVAPSGYLSKYEMSFKMGVNVEGLSTTMTVDSSMDYIEFDPAKITITPPAGYQDFVETELG